MNGIEKNIVDNMNLILYNYINERDDAVNDILAISRHSWRTTTDVQTNIIIQASGIAARPNNGGVGDRFMPSFISLMRRCKSGLKRHPLNLQIK
jgi:hypothetical protein